MVALEAVHEVAVEGEATVEGAMVNKTNVRPRFIKLFVIH